MRVGGEAGDIQTVGRGNAKDSKEVEKKIKVTGENARYGLGKAGTAQITEEALFKVYALLSMTILGIGYFLINLLSLRPNER